MFKNKNFRYFFLSKLFSVLSVSIVLIGTVKWMEVKSDSIEALSWLFVCYTSVFLFLGIPIGTWIQHRNKKQTIMYAISVRIALAICFWLIMDTAPIYVGFIYIVLDSIPFLFLLPSERALASKIMPKDQLIKANSFLNFGDVIPMLIGAFSVSMLLKQNMPIHYIFCAAAVGWLISLFLISQITYVEIKDVVHHSVRSYLSKMKTDLVYVKNKPELLRLFLFFSLFWAVYTPVQDVIAIHYLVDLQGKGAEEIGIFNSMFRLGNLMIIAFIPFLYRTLERKWFLVIPFFSYSLYLFLMASNTPYAFLLFMNILIGMATNLMFVFFISYLQETIPSEKQGSIFGFHGMVVQGVKGPAAFFLTLSIPPIGFSANLTGLCVYLVVVGLISCLTYPRIGKGSSIILRK